MNKAERYRLKQCVDAVVFRNSEVYRRLTEMEKYLDEIYHLLEVDKERMSRNLHVETAK